MRATAGAALLAACLTACTGSSSPHRRATTTATTAGTGLAVALLDAADVAGYRTTPVTASAPTPLPCTAKQPPLTTQYPPDSRAQAAFASASTDSAFREVLLGYAATTDADAAYAAVQDGFNCSRGTLDGTAVRIAHVGAVSQGGYRGERWDFTLADGTLGSAVVGQAGATIVEINFVATQGGTAEADPGAVLQKALQKVADHSPR